MPMTMYYSVNGRLLGESTNGVETTYMSDALGSTIGTVTTAGLQNRYTYSPYGVLLGKTGPDADPKFTWNGRSGYRTTGRTNVDKYVRKRHFSLPAACWSSADPLWPRQLPYAYADGMPTSFPDYSGLRLVTVQPTTPTQGSTLQSCCSTLLSKLGDPATKAAIERCMSTGPLPFSPGDTDWFISLLSDLCSPSSKDTVCISAPGSAKNPPGWPAGCTNPCPSDSSLYGETGFGGGGSSQMNPPKCVVDSLGAPNSKGIPLKPYVPGCEQFSQPGGGGCNCSIVLCDSTFDFQQYAEQSTCAILFHEMSHCSGLGHTDPGDIPGSPNRVLDFIYRLGCCVCRATQGVKQCGAECNRPPNFQPG